VSWLAGIRSLFTPGPCGHEAELAQLRSTNRERWAEIQRLRERTSALIAEAAKLRDSAQAHSTRREIAESNARALQTRVNDLEGAIERRDINARIVIDDLNGKLDEAATALEESNSRVAILEQRIRESLAALEDEQLALIHAPVTHAEGGGETVDVQPELVRDETQRRFYRILAVFFEGNRHHWLFASGDARAKAPIHDKEFLERVHKGEVTFAAGQMLEGDIRVRTYRRGADVYEDIAVERVVNLVPPPQQSAIPGTEEVTNA
jgi:chromosome segregation ATPase